MAGVTGCHARTRENCRRGCRRREVLYGFSARAVVRRGERSDRGATRRTLREHSQTIVQVRPAPPLPAMWKPPSVIRPGLSVVTSESHRTPYNEPDDAHANGRD